MRTIAVLDTVLRLCYGVRMNFGSLTATKTNRVLYIRDTSCDTTQDTLPIVLFYYRRHYP